MRIKKPLSGIMLLLFITLVAPVFVLNKPIYAEILEIFPSKNINVDTDTAVVPLPSILDKIHEKDDELAKVPVSIGRKEVVYYENRYTLLAYKTQAECDKRNGLWNEKDHVCKSVVQKRS